MLSFNKDFRLKPPCEYWTHKQKRRNAARIISCKPACRWCEVHPSPSIWQHIAAAPCTSLQCYACRWRATAEGPARRRGGRPGEELWEDGVGAGGKAAVAALPWYSANELHCCSTRTSFAPQETSLADRAGEREPRRHARAQPQHAAGTMRTRRAAICMF